MLKRMYAAFHQEHSEPLAAWDRMIEFLAVDYRWQLTYELAQGLDWLFKKPSLVAEVSKVYRPELLEGRWDYLGDMYAEKFLPATDYRRRQMLAEPEEVLSLLEASGLNRRHPPKAILDRCAGTGKYLVGSRVLAPKTEIFGVEKDTRLARICLTNFAISGIDGYVLIANPDKHETDISKPNGRHNWQYANRWNPCTDKLLPVSPSSQITLSP